MTPADVIAAHADVARGEAALTVAGRARDSGDARYLLGVLGLTGISWRWDLPRAAAAIVASGRGGGAVSMNTLRFRLPASAAELVPAALRELQAAGLLAPTGSRPVSRSPGAKGRRVREYTLTAQGERAAREIVPYPGEGPNASSACALELGALP